MDSVDVVVIGAGVVGLACAKQLAEAGREVIALERETAFGTGISARNSEVIHAGLYYPPGSLKAALCVQGRRALYTYCAERGIAHRRIGKLVVASRAPQLPALEAIAARARTNGVEAVTPMHGWIMEYLYRHSETPVFQRDIEREFSITRSTVTNILQLMERKGYITRRSVEQDARLKQLVLTEKGRQFHEDTMRAFHQTDEYVAGLLTEEENTELLRLLNKLYLGLK